MSERPHSPRALRRASRSLQKKYGGCNWFRGVGIVPADDGPALRLNVDPGQTVADDIPQTYYNIPVKVVRIKGYTARRR